MSNRGKTQERNSNFQLPKELPYDFLKKITDDFSNDRKISGGPFGTLYKGIVPDDGTVMAVKKLHENLPMPADRTFEQEVRNAMALKHENLVEVVGYCKETTKKLVQFDNRYIVADITESLLCYEYLPNGSLEENLFGIEPTEHIMDWDTRFKIIEGISQGLRFLHFFPIIHMDLKPENILLGENMVPKICSFELSRVFGQEQTRLCTQTVVGSYGYMAPEYLYRGEISAQSDIYSLGLMILEITTGEKNCRDKNEPSARNYIDKIQNDWTPEFIALKHPSLDSEGLQRVKRCINIGLDCVSIDRKRRPPIEKIISRLHGRS